MLVYSNRYRQEVTLFSFSIRWPVTLSHGCIHILLLLSGGCLSKLHECHSDAVSVHVYVEDVLFFFNHRAAIRFVYSSYILVSRVRRTENRDFLDLRH